MRNQQQGITLISFLIVAVVVVSIVIFGIKVAPYYSEYFSVKQAMEKVAGMPGANRKSAAEIKSYLDKNLGVSYVTSVSSRDFILKKKGGYRLSIDYEVREHIAFNMDVVIMFSHEVPLTGG